MTGRPKDAPNTLMSRTAEENRMATTTITDYTTWYATLDAYMWRKHGLSVDDVEDYCWIDLFDDGFTPAQAITCWRQDR